MIPHRPARLLLPLFIVLATRADACLWDYDTLRDERRGLPGIAEVLAGKWEKHSPFFYQQRVAQMEALIAREPGNLAAYDNLAVAQEKVGNPEAAIDVMLRKEKVKPGEYTTYANLGTFYLHKGDLDNGIAYIRKALEINPSAHFGREEYQLKLAEFLREGHKHPQRMEDMNFLGIRAGRKVLLEESVAATRPVTQPAEEEPAHWVRHHRWNPLAEVGVKDNAFDGIVGMIRFGTGSSAELYLTLGDLLVLRGDKALAYRAYQRALDLHHPRQKYVRGAMEAIEENAEHTGNGDSVSSHAIEAERASATKWVKAYQDYEDNLLRSGKDVNDEANYAAFYNEHGQARETLGFSVGDLLPRDPTAKAGLVIMAFLGCVVLLLALVAMNWYRRRKSARRLSAGV